MVLIRMNHGTHLLKAILIFAIVAFLYRELSFFYNAAKKILENKEDGTPARFLPPGSVKITPGSYYRPWSKAKPVNDPEHPRKFKHVVENLTDENAFPSYDGVESSVEPNRLQRRAQPWTEIPPYLLGSTKESELLTDEEWNPLVCKGRRLLRLMHLDDEQLAKEQPQSLYQDYGLMEYWGWEKKSEPDEWLPTYEVVFQDLFHLPGAVIEQQMESNVLSHEGSVNVHATYGEYSCTYIPREGMIIAHNIVGPDHTGIGKEMIAQGQPLPGLKQCSDVVFLEWNKQREELLAEDVPLKYMAQSQIVNDWSNRVMSTALFKTNQIISPWAHRSVFTMDTDAGKAVLASPNVVGTVWMLLQHRAITGRRTITKIEIFYAQYSSSAGSSTPSFIDPMPQPVGLGGSGPGSPLDSQPGSPDSAVGSGDGNPEDRPWDVPPGFNPDDDLNRPPVPVSGGGYYPEMIIYIEDVADAPPLDFDVNAPEPASGSANAPPTPPPGAGQFNPPAARL